MSSRRYVVQVAERSFCIEIADDGQDRLVRLFKADSGPAGDLTPTRPAPRRGRRLRSQPAQPDFEGAAFLRPRGDGAFLLHLGDRAVDVLLNHTPEGTEVGVLGRAVTAQVCDERVARLVSIAPGQRSASRIETIKAPMPGLVVAVTVEAGQSIFTGQRVVVLQAMKMENELTAPRDGVVRQVHVQPGQIVEHGQLLVELV